MTESNLKKIAEQIKKMAQGADDLGDVWGTGGKTKPQGGGGAARPGGGGGGGGGFVNVVGDIKNMQAAMQNFAAAVTKYSFKKATKPGEKPAVDDSKKPFNDFITETYMMDSPIKGQEFSPDPARQKQQEKQPTDLIEMNNVIDGLRRIGSPDRPGMSGNELKADNVWDFRTNNALKNIYAFAYALVNLSKDFGRTNVNSFGDADLNKMADLIPKEENPSSMPAAEKKEKAKALVPVINKLTTFYQYYVDAIANHPAYVRYIIGEEPLMTVKPGGGDPLALNEEEKKLMPNLDQLTVNFGQGPLPLSAFKNLNYFRQFLTEQMKYPPNQTSNPKILLAFLNSFVSMADSYLQKSQPKQQPATPPTEQRDAGTPSGTGGVAKV